MNEHILQFKKGLKDGVPIGLGYLAVSFTFGIMAKGAGLTTLEAVVLSLTNLTSAGQFAGLGIITAGSSLLEMALAQLIINLRYCLMAWCAPVADRAFLEQLIDAEHIVTEGCYELLMFSQNLSGTDSHRTS